MLGKFAICFFSIPGASSAPGSASTVMESSGMAGHLFSPLVVVCRAHLSNWSASPGRPTGGGGYRLGEGNSTRVVSPFWVIKSRSPRLINVTRCSHAPKTWARRTAIKAGGGGIIPNVLPGGGLRNLLENISRRERDPTRKYRREKLIFPFSLSFFRPGFESLWQGIAPTETFFRKISYRFVPFPPENFPVPSKVVPSKFEHGKYVRLKLRKREREREREGGNEWFLARQRRPRSSSESSISRDATVRFTSAVLLNLCPSKVDGGDWKCA